ncbi:MAG: UPF0147 family protein [Candidatus Micrarchaeia archaeon]
MSFLKSQGVVASAFFHGRMSENHQVIFMEEKTAEIIEMLENVIGDTSVPKNIRRSLSDAKERLKGQEELSTRVGAAIYAIESVSEDINMPMHARTQIWAILSALESNKAAE